LPSYVVGSDRSCYGQVQAVKFETIIESIFIFKLYFLNILPRDVMLAWYVSVHAFVYLSQAGTVLKWLNAGSRKQRRT